MNNFYCPVCGFPNLAEEPRDLENGSSYEICPSCGFEFGYTDESEGISDETWRREWLAGGAMWFSASRKGEQPENWNGHAQWDRYRKL